MANKHVYVRAFDVPFYTLHQFRLATGFTGDLHNGKIKYGSVEELVRRQKRFKYKTDEEITAMLQRSSTELTDPTLTTQVLDLIKDGMLYQLSREVMPKDEVYFLAKRIYDAPDFKQALRGLVESIPNKYSGSYSGQRGRLNPERHEYHRSRIAREY